jgi:hypothetical protein
MQYSRVPPSSERAQHADGCRLGGGGNAGVDAAQHRHDEQHHRDQVA